MDYSSSSSQHTVPCSSKSEDAQGDPPVSCTETPDPHTFVDIVVEDSQEEGMGNEQCAEKSIDIPQEIVEDEPECSSESQHNKGFAQIGGPSSLSRQYPFLPDFHPKFSNLCIEVYV